MSVYLDTVFLLKVEGYFDMANNTPTKFVAGETILDKNIKLFTLIFQSIFQGINRTID